jgi:hypothetical protein
MSESVTITVAAIEESVGVTVAGTDTVSVSVAGDSETVQLLVTPGEAAVALAVTQTVDAVALAVQAVAETVAVAIADLGDTVSIAVADGNAADAAAETFETVSRNLRSYPATLSYAAGELSAISYATPGGAAVKTFHRVAGRLASIVLSGSLPAGIATTKTLSYTGDSLTSVGYA